MTVGNGYSGGKKKKKKGVVVALVVLLVVLLVVGIGGAAYVIWQQQKLDQAAQEQAETAVPETPEATDDANAGEAQEETVENPVSISSLQLENSDIYAWIYVPGTDVNYPIVQSVTDDNFYLDHDVDGEYSVGGAIYTQSMNSTDFSDPVTVIYGHNLVNNTMFSTLHNFEDATFFEENDTMYIYTLDRILTYRIIAAYEYDNRHIMNSYDFTNATELQSYFDSVLNPSSMVVNVREGVTLTTSDKIVQLSTCMSGTYHGNTRYIVTGVLVDEQQTS